MQLDEHLVADGCRVDDQVATARVRRPLTGAGVETRVGREGRSERARGPAGADHAGVLGGDPGEDLLVGVEAEHASVAEDERVHGVALGLVARCDHGLLVRDRDVRAGEAELAQRRDARERILDVVCRVVPVEPARAKAAFCMRGDSECATGCPRSPMCVVNSRTRARTRSARTPWRSP